VKLLKWILTISIAILLGVLIAKGLMGQTDLNRSQDSEPKNIVLADHLHGKWVTIGRSNHREPGGEFNPNWTYILLESPIKPVIRKIGERYQITFTTPLTKDLP